MEERSPPKQREDRMASLNAAELDADSQTTQDTPGDAQRIHSHPSGLRAEQDAHQPFVATDHQDKGSPRMFASQKGPEVTLNERTVTQGHGLGIQRPQNQNSSPISPGRDMEHHLVASSYHTHDSPGISSPERGRLKSDDQYDAQGPEQETQRSPESSSSSFESSLPIPPPNYRRNSQGELTGDMEEPRTPFNPQGYGVPRHQLMVDHPFTFGQPAPVQQQLKSPPNPQETSDYQEQQRRFQYDPQFQEERYRRSRKRKKRRGTHGKQAERWDQMFARLCEFKRIHGHCLVPNRYINDPSLGAWVSTQRRHYKILLSDDPSQTSPMTPERASKLISIGFQWATKDPRHVPWETRFQELLAYKKEYGDCVVPIGFKENPRLSNWVSAQRQEYKLFKQGKKCRITAERVQALNAIGFVWEAQRGSSGAQRKKRDHKDAALGRAAAEMLSLASSGNANVATPGSSSFGGQRNPSAADNLSHDFAQAALSHALSSLLGTQQQSNEPETAQGGTGLTAASTAARRMEDIVALQQQNIAPPAAQRIPTAASAAKSRDAVHPSLVINDARARQLQELSSGGLTAPPLPAVVSAMQNHMVPQGVADDEMVTRHLIHALRNDPGANAMGLEAAIRLIHGILGITGDHNLAAAIDTARQRSSGQASRMALPMQPAALKPPPSSLLSSLSSPGHFAYTAAKSDSEETETESESSKYGAALQVGEVRANPAAVANLGFAHSTEGLNTSIRPRHSLEGVEPSLSPGLESRKRPATMISRGIGDDRLAGIKRTTGDGPGSMSQASEKSSSASDKGQRNNGGSGNDDGGGIFSDAEEN